MGKYIEKKTTKKTHNLFWYAVRTSSIRNIEDLVNYCQMLEDFSDSGGSKNRITHNLVMDAINQIAPLSDAKRKNVKDILKKQGMKLSIDSSRTCLGILEDIFKERRSVERNGNEHQQKESTSSEVPDSATVVTSTGKPMEEINSEVKDILNKYPSEVQKIFVDMIASLDAAQELQRLSNIYDEYRKNFKTAKEKERRNIVMRLFECTYIESFEEVATLLYVELIEITSLFKGKAALQKKIDMYIIRSRRARNERRIAKDPEAEAVRRAEEKAIAEKASEAAKQAKLEAEKARRAAEEAEAAEKARKAAEKAEAAEKARKAAEKAEAAEKARRAAEEAEAAEKARKAAKKAEEAEKAKKAVSEKSDKENDPWKRSYSVRDGVAIWSSHISKTSRPSEVLLDTNILIDERLRNYVEKHFKQGAVSMISVLELRRLLKNSRDVAMRALSNLVKAVNERYFYKPVCDTESDLTGDCDIKLAELATNNDYTFITKDMGASVYAWTIGCPCRYMRTDPIEINMHSSSGATPKIAILDVNTEENQLSNMLRATYSHVIITNLFARRLNSNKINNEFAVGALQMDICTDTDGFYEPYLMKVGTKDYVQYEIELLKICKERKAVLVSSNPETLALAWEHGIETFYHARK